MKTQLLCTFTKRNRLKDTIEEIINIYDIVFERIYVLENLENKKELLCTYNISEMKMEDTLRNTISIHRKKQTHTLYTINALNEIVMHLNEGRMDPTFPIEWENYKNTLLVTDENGLKEIRTKVVDIINTKEYNKE